MLFLPLIRCVVYAIFVRHFALYCGRPHVRVVLVAIRARYSERSGTMIYCWVIESMRARHAASCALTDAHKLSTGVGYAWAHFMLLFTLAVFRQSRTSHCLSFPLAICCVTVVLTVQSVPYSKTDMSLSNTNPRSTPTICLNWC